MQPQRSEPIPSVVAGAETSKIVEQPAELLGLTTISPAPADFYQTPVPHTISILAVKQR